MADPSAPRTAAAARAGVSIRANHRRYLAMDACLQAAAGDAIRTHFFAAAACVTHPRGGLGALDGALGRLVFAPGEAAFLRHVHGVLAALNRGWFARLRRGVELAGCEGLRGRALDHALVELEQARFTAAMRAYFGDDAALREATLGGVNRALRRHPLLRPPWLEWRLGAALVASGTRRCRDLADEAQRCAVGHALVDLVRASRCAPLRERA
jgi:hypothetical protein